MSKQTFAEKEVGRHQWTIGRAPGVVSLQSGARAADHGAHGRSAWLKPSVIACADSTGRRGAGMRDKGIFAGKRARVMREGQRVRDRSKIEEDGAMPTARTE
eukprot:6198606-Pleurochrysis_carterae.AAC.2